MKSEDRKLQKRENGTAKSHSTGRFPGTGSTMARTPLAAKQAHQERRLSRLVIGPALSPQSRKMHPAQVVQVSRHHARTVGCDDVASSDTGSCGPCSGIRRPMLSLPRRSQRLHETSRIESRPSISRRLMNPVGMAVTLARRGPALQRLEVLGGCLAPAGIGHQVVLHPLAFIQSLKPGLLHRGDMHECVRSAAILGSRRCRTHDDGLERVRELGLGAITSAFA
jgi:hypothetical protein